MGSAVTGRVAKMRGTRSMQPVFLSVATTSAVGAMAGFDWPQADTSAKEQIR
jgi:uncharacterized membrane protein AbrB (regulator of aidB expression)